MCARLASDFYLLALSNICPKDTNRYAICPTNFDFEIAII